MIRRYEMHLLKQRSSRLIQQPKLPLTLPLEFRDPYDNPCTENPTIINCQLSSLIEGYHRGILCLRVDWLQKEG